MRGRLARWLPLTGLVLLGSSCRSILGITPGKEAPDGGSGGEISTNGGAETAAGSGGKGSAGKSGTGGAGATAGQDSNGGGTSGGQAGEAGAGPMSLLPAGACADCMARNCSAQVTACQADSTCSAGVPDWLGCTEPDAGTCVTSDAGALQDLESCGVQSCDLCQHLTDHTPTIEILAPANGAEIGVDSMNLVEVTVRVDHFTVMTLGSCGTRLDCGHIHLNIDDEDNDNCRATPFYNRAIFSVGTDNVSDSSVDITSCKMPIFGKQVALTASLSDHASHADRVPPIKATVMVTLTKL